MEVLSPIVSSASGLTRRPGISWSPILTRWSGWSRWAWLAWRDCDRFTNCTSWPSRISRHTWRSWNAVPTGPSSCSRWTWWSWEAAWFAGLGRCALSCIVGGLTSRSSVICRRVLELCNLVPDLFCMVLKFRHWGKPVELSSCSLAYPTESDFRVHLIANMHHVAVDHWNSYTYLYE